MDRLGALSGVPEEVMGIYWPILEASLGVLEASWSPRIPHGESGGRPQGLVRRDMYIDIYIYTHTYIYIYIYIESRARFARAWFGPWGEEKDEEEAEGDREVRIT